MLPSLFFHEIKSPVDLSSFILTLIPDFFVIEVGGLGSPNIIFSFVIGSDKYSFKNICKPKNKIFSN
jgi:hypothetical protein